MSAVIPLAMENGMNVTITEIVFGMMWLATWRLLDAPSALAASTYSRDFSL